MRSRSLSVLVGLVLLTACSATPPPAEPGPASATPTGLALPPRPRDVPVDDVDPCDLLTDAQRADLGLDGDPIPYQGSDSALLGPTKACSISGFQPRAISFAIRLGTEQGIDSFANADPPATPIEVAGFPAVLSPPRPTMPDNCIVAVDVAPGQMLTVLLRDGGRVPPIPLEQLCAEVPDYAAQVMDTLLAR